MKPITFENLRRLMGGGRKKKEKESSFKRSDSFKRISIRKSYLDRGGRKKHTRKEPTPQEEVFEVTKCVEAPEGMQSITEVEPSHEDRKDGVGQSVIAYGNWLRGVRVNEVPVTGNGIRGCERTIIYVPASDDSLPAPPVIRQLSASPVMRRKSPTRSKSPGRSISPSISQNRIENILETPVIYADGAQFHKNDRRTFQVIEKNHIQTTDQVFAVQNPKTLKNNSPVCHKKGLKQLKQISKPARKSKKPITDETPIVCHSAINLETSPVLRRAEHNFKPVLDEAAPLIPRQKSPVRKLSVPVHKSPVFGRKATRKLSTPVQPTCTSPIFGKSSKKGSEPSLSGLFAKVTKKDNSYDETSPDFFGNKKVSKSRNDSTPIFGLASPTSPGLRRKESNDSAVEMFPWGDETRRSPIFSRKAISPQPSLIPDANDEMCSLSVSLGRIWMDAPLAMAPRSLELPRPQPAVQAHNSLDSALKDRNNPVVSNRLQKPVPPVSRTLSATSTATASTGMFSSKDSGFSFSISIPKLTDFTPTSGHVPSRGFFRKKRPKPKLSVSRDGYFKRTSGALEIRRNSVKRKSSRKKARSSGRKKKLNSAKNEMYQVVINRPPRDLTSLKLDPMIFVPPEKRKPSVRRKKSFKLSLQEIRTFKDDCGYQTVEELLNTDEEDLYECISGDFDDASGRISRISNHFYENPLPGQVLELDNAAELQKNVLEFGEDDSLQTIQKLITDDLKKEVQKLEHASLEFSNDNTTWKGFQKSTNRTSGHSKMDKLRKNMILEFTAWEDVQESTVLNLTNDILIKSAKPDLETTKNDCNFEECSKNTPLYRKHQVLDNLKGDSLLNKFKPDSNSDVIEGSVSDESIISKNSDQDNSTDDDTSVKSSTGSTGSLYLPAGVHVRKKPVLRRKKSTAVKKLGYLAKPSILRAPSTLRRSKKKLNKTSPVSNE